MGRARSGSNARGIRRRELLGERLVEGEGGCSGCLHTLGRSHRGRRGVAPRLDAELGAPIPSERRNGAGSSGTAQTTWPIRHPSMPSRSYRFALADALILYSLPLRLWPGRRSRQRGGCRASLALGKWPACPRCRRSRRSQRANYQGCPQRQLWSYAPAVGYQNVPGRLRSSPDNPSGHSDRRCT